MDIGKTLSNPMVLIAGAGIGLVMLMSKQAAPAASPNSGNNLTYNSAVSAYNIHALDAVTQQYSLAVDYGKAELTSDVTKTLGILDWMKNLNDNRSVVEAATVQSNNGIIQAAISANAAVAIDQANNRARLGEAYTSVKLGQIGLESTRVTAYSEEAIAGINAQRDVRVAGINGSTSVSVAQLQASALKKASKNNMIGSIANTIGSVAKLAFL